MEGNTATNVTAGKPMIGGAIFKFATNATLPSSIDDSIDDGICLGYISQDGITNANTPSSTSIKAFGGDTVLSIEGDKVDTFQFKLIEALNIDVLKTVFGAANVTGDLESGVKIEVNNKALDENAYVIDMMLRNNARKRIVISRAKVITVAPVKYTDSDAIGYDVTIEAYGDANGNTHVEYIKK